MSRFWVFWMRNTIRNVTIVVDGVDHELPGVAEPEQRPAKRPDHDDADGGQEGHRLAGIVRCLRSQARKQAGVAVRLRRLVATPAVVRLAAAATLPLRRFAMLLHDPCSIGQCLPASESSIGPGEPIFALTVELTKRPCRTHNMRSVSPCLAGL